MLQELFDKWLDEQQASGNMEYTEEQIEAVQDFVHAVEKALEEKAAEL